MNQEHLKALLEVEKDPDIIFPNVRHFDPEFDGQAKTLLYGYNTDRDTWHVFCDHLGNIYLYVYKQGLDGKPSQDIAKIDVSNDGISSLQKLVPNKRLYPHFCDYDFCKYLKSKNAELSFATWREPKYEEGNIFAGEIF